MLVQDMLTGQLHEVPDHMAGTDEWPDPQVYGLGEVHDGYGNSLGLFFLPKLIQKAVGAIRGGLPGGQPAPPAVVQNCPPCPVCSTTMPYPGQPMPLMPPGYPPGFPGRSRRRRRRS